MTYELILTSRAQKDVEQAVAYYDQIDFKLASRFLAELSDTYRKLSKDPQFYSFVVTHRKTAIRDVGLKSFPFLVIYEIRETTVMIISVANRYKKPLFP